MGSTTSILRCCQQERLSLILMERATGTGIHFILESGKEIPCGTCQGSFEWQELSLRLPQAEALKNYSRVLLPKIGSAIYYYT